jgi:hypothetical protein
MDVVVATVVDSLVSEDVLVEVDDVDIFLDVKVEAVDVTDREVQCVSRKCYPPNRQTKFYLVLCIYTLCS